MTDIVITDEMIELFARNRARQAIDPTQVDAYVDGLRNSQGWANVRAGLEAVAPLLRAQWEAEHAGLVDAAWSMCVEQQAGNAPGWSMAKSWAWDNLNEALESFLVTEEDGVRVPPSLAQRAQSVSAGPVLPETPGTAPERRSGPYSGPEGGNG